MPLTKQKLLFGFICLQLLGAAALILSFYVGVWQLELLISFTPLLVTVLIASISISSLLIALLKNFKQNLPFLILAGATWLAALFILFHAFTAQVPVKVAASSGETITFATFNKLYSNYDIERSTSYLHQQAVDIIAMQEVRPAQVSGIAEQLGLEHTHTSRTFATSGGTSVVLFSRYPFVSVETIELATKHPVVRAEIKTPHSGNVVVYSVHIPVPSSPFLYNKRNIVLDSLAEAVQKETLPVLIGGDFNTTVYSPVMRTFSGTVSSHITPITTERIPACSWYGYGSFMCVRIDHIFAPKNAQVTRLTISPDIGADHRAIIADIILERSVH